MGYTNTIIRRREQLEQIETRERQRISALSAILNVMVNAVQKAGRHMTRDFGEVSQLQVTQKGPADFVSNADLIAEKVLIENLSEDRPDYAIISEEHGAIAAKNDSPFTWIIDPIDGTTNFIHALPHFATSVALKHHDDIVAAVLYNPILNHLYYAEKGQGAFLLTSAGAKRLRVSGRTDLSNCLLGLDSKLFPRFDNKAVGLRHYGSTSLALAGVAAGQMDGVVIGKQKIWDLAAGYLFIQEAGGRVATLDGKTDLSNLMKADYIIASNLSLWTTLQQQMKG